MKRKRVYRVREPAVTLPTTKTKWNPIIKEEKINPHDYFGFVYVITNTVTGKKYIGRKNYWIKLSIKGCKSLKTSDKQNKAWKPCCWKESDWRTYKGSSKTLTKDIKDIGVSKFTFEIVSQHRSRGTLHYGEIEYQVLSNCMWEMLKDGSDHAYYNRQIAAVKFRPQEFFKDETNNV